VQGPGFNSPSPTKKHSLSQVWWHKFVVPASQETESGGLLEPINSRPDCTTVRTCLKQTNNKKPRFLKQFTRRYRICLHCYLPMSFFPLTCSHNTIFPYSTPARVVPCSAYCLSSSLCLDIPLPSVLNSRCVQLTCC
jgi:hypothetical protein